MKIVIKISEEDYKLIKSYGKDSTNYRITLNLYDAVKNGTPLPEHHGRLIDADDIRVIELEDSLHIIRHEKGDDIDVYIDAPTIIEGSKIK